MSRRGDRLKCKGVICQGITTIHVGGEPAQSGKELEEEGENETVKWMEIGFSAAQLSKEKGVDLALSLIGLAAKIFDDKRAADTADELKKANEWHEKAKEWRERLHGG
jgi:hypothetical protein